MAFTADFTRYTKYDEKSNATIVRFAAGAPALETEFNELQLIADKRIRDVTSLFGDGLIDGNVNHVDDKVVVEDCRAIVGGNLFYISKLELGIDVGEEVFLDVFTKEVTYRDVMHKYGNEQEAEIENYILDSRFGKEISRREVLCFDLTKTTGVEGHVYLPIAKIDETGEFIVEAPESGNTAKEAIKQLENTVTGLSNNLLQLISAVSDLSDESVAQRKSLVDLSVAVNNRSRVAELDIIIPKTGWVSDEEISTADTDGKYPVSVDINIKGVTDKMHPDLTFWPKSEGDVAACGFCHSEKVMADVLRCYALTVPENDIYATLTLTGVYSTIDPDGSESGGGGGSSYVLPIATANRLGGVKLGEGISGAEDGTISVAGSKVAPEYIAPASDVSEMIRDIFG